MAGNGKKIMLIGVFSVLLLAGFWFGNSNSDLAVANQDPTKSSLAVSGQGKASVKPDMAAINVGVTTENKTAKGAQSENNERMEKVIAAIKGAGVKDEDIRTINYNLHAKYDYSSNKQVLIGYVSTNQVQVTVQNITAVGKILDMVVSSGANLSGGITFILSDDKRDKAYADALTLALKNASGKAEVLAKGLGVKLGKPKDVVEGGGYSSTPIFERGLYDEAKLKAEAVPISEGQLEVSASVNLRYEY